MRVDPNDEHESSSFRSGSPRRALLMRGCRSCFEPRHSTGTGGQTHRSEANPKAAGHYRDTPAGTLDGVIDYSTPEFLGVRTAEGLYRFFGRNHFGGAPRALRIASWQRRSSILICVGVHQNRFGCVSE